MAQVITQNSTKETPTIPTTQKQYDLVVVFILFSLCIVASIIADQEEMITLAINLN